MTHDRSLSQFRVVAVGSDRHTDNGQLLLVRGGLRVERCCNRKSVSDGHADGNRDSATNQGDQDTQAHVNNRSGCDSHSQLYAITGGICNIFSKRY